MDMEGILILLALFFLGDPAEFAKILFWLIISFLGTNTIMSCIGSFGRKWRWSALYALEAFSLIWANFAAEWGTELQNVYAQRDILLARVGDHLYPLLLLFTVAIQLCFYGVRKAKEHIAAKQ